MIKESQRLPLFVRSTPRVPSIGRGAWPLLWLFCAGFVGCASAPPAPVESRTAPLGGHLRPTPVPAPVAPVVSGRPAGTSPASAASGPAVSGSTAPPSRPSATPSRPAAVPEIARAEGASSAGPMQGPGSAVQSTPLTTPTLESRPLDAPRPPSASSAPTQSPSPVASASIPPSASSSSSVPGAPTPAASPASGATVPAAAGAIEFSWPVPGRILQSYGETGKGITLAGNPGDPVMAAAEGRVIFSGSGPRGYGNLIIVKHPNDLLSVYAHNRKLLVKEGQNVARGERIAELGDTGGNTPRLHFEIRRQGKPVDPTPYLPRR